MKRIVVAAILVFFASLIIMAVDSPNTPEAQKAKALVEKGIAYFQANGKVKFFLAVSDTKGQFVDGEYYLFVDDFSGVTLAHGGNNALVGKNNLELKDPDGVPFTKEFIKIVKEKGEGWVQYRWVNPKTSKVEKKLTFVKKLPGLDALVGCGYYVP